MSSTASPAAPLTLLWSPDAHHREFAHCAGAVRAFFRAARRRELPWDIAPDIPRFLCVAHLCSETMARGDFARCSRCKAAYYATPGAQRANWRYHKGSCGAPDPGAVAALDAHACLERTLAAASGSATPNTGLILARLFHLVQNHFDKAVRYRIPRFDDEDFEYKMHVRLGLGMPMKQMTAHWKQFWAAPHVAEVLLSTALVKAPQEGGGVRARGGARPTSDSGSDDGSESGEESEPESSESFGSGGGAAYTNAFLLFNLLVSSAVGDQRQTMSGCHDGLGTPREGALGAAACRRALELWLDPQCRASCGDALAPGASLALTTLRHAAPERRRWLIDGGVGSASLDELHSSGAGASQYALPCLREVREKEWRAAPATVREDFVLRALHRIGDGGDGGGMSHVRPRDARRAAAGAAAWSLPTDPEQRRAMLLRCGALQRYHRAARGFDGRTDYTARELCLWLADKLAGERNYGPQQPMPEVSPQELVAVVKAYRRLDSDSPEKLGYTRRALSAADWAGVERIYRDEKREETVTLRRAGGAGDVGVELSPTGMVVRAVAEGSPAAATAARFVGWWLVAVNGVCVYYNDEVAGALGDAAEVTLTFRRPRPAPRKAGSAGDDSDDGDASDSDGGSASS